MMGAIAETEPGGEMVCILGFSARPRSLDNEPVSGKRRTFSVGERVRYLTSYYKATPEDNPTGYMAVFQPLDPKDTHRYAATQDYFVTLDCWDGLKDYFTRALAVVERDLVTQQPTGRQYRLMKIRKPSSRTARKSS